MASVPSPLSLEDINARDAAGFNAVLGGVVEHSPWVAADVADKRPFASIDALWTAMLERVAAASVSTREELFRKHPELAGAEAVAGRMTGSSTSEQGRLGLNALPAEDFQRLASLNRRYRERFGFPCIIALRMHASVATVFETFERRLSNEIDAERQNNLAEIAEIVRGRLYTLLEPRGWLSTHVLDTATGVPAAGVRIDLREKRPGGWRTIVSTRSNGDGRTDARLLSGPTMMAGVYRLDFHVGEYFRARGAAMENPAFLDIVPVRFGVLDPNLHYHVPLLCSPWSYTTYRGS